MNNIPVLCLEGQRLQVACLNLYDPVQRSLAQLRFQDHVCICPICRPYLSLLASLNSWQWRYVYQKEPK